MKRLPLTLAVMLCAMAASASEMAIPDGALMNYRFDNTVTDMVEGNMLMTYDPETGSCTPVDDPEYAKDGGLVLDRYYAVEGDFSIRLYQSQSIVVRMRTGKQIDDAGPLLRFGDADSGSTGGKYLFEIDGDNIIVYGASSSKTESFRYSMKLPKADKSGYITYVVTYSYGYCVVYAGNKRCAFYADDGFKKSEMDRLVLCPFKDGVITDLAFYNKRLTLQDVERITGQELKYDLEIGDKDSAGNNPGRIIWPIVFIILNIWLASVAVKQRREMDEQGRHYTFNGNPVIILISAVGVLCYIILMFRGGGFAFFIGLIQLAVSIAAYLLLAYRPVSQEEFHILEAEKARQREEGQKGMKPMDYIKELLVLLAGSAASLAGKTITKAGETMADSTRIEETYLNGTLVKREKTLDIISLITPLIGVAVAIGFVIALFFMAVQIVVSLMSFLPLYRYISNRRKYKDFDDGAPASAEGQPD